MSASPLAEIERIAQERADTLAVDLATADGPHRLRRLVTDAVDHWNAEHRDGRREVALAEDLVERAFRNLAGYGPLGPLLEDDDVWEIMVNAPDAVFVKRHRGPDGPHDDLFHDDDHVLRVLTRILDDATGAHRKLDPTLGLQDAQLEDGARLHIVHRDLSRGGHTMVNIRKFTGVAYRRLDELVGTGMLDRSAADLLATLVRGGASLLVSGRPGAGKTTLLSCCVAELDPRCRVVVAEEVFEAEVPISNVASMQTRGPRPDRPEVGLRRLVAAFLRMAPDVAIVGEVRDREALPLLLTLTSGVAGHTTIHAGSATQALSRLRFVCQLADEAANLAPAALTALVADAIDVVIHCARTPAGPRVLEILAVEDLASGDSGRFTTTPLLERSQPDAPLRPTGARPTRLAARLAANGVDLTGPLAGVTVLSALFWGLLAAAGVHLLWSRPRERRPFDRSAARRHLRAAALPLSAGLAGTTLGLIAIGGPVAIGVGGLAAACSLLGRRSVTHARREQTRRLWPSLLEEIRVLTTSGGRSLPRALLEVGTRAPSPTGDAFRTAQQTWRVSADFERTLGVLKAELADADTDVVTETLLVAHEVGGADVGRRLARLAEDRRRDLAARDLATAKLAGARFARRFVIIVPLGMAVAGQAVGTGRQAFASPAGQAVGLLAAGLVAACWLWAGTLLRLPEPPRVFA